MGRPVTDSVPTLDVVVVARLLDRRICADSGVQHYGLVMKYELVEIKAINSGSLIDFAYQPKDQLYIVHGAPELPRPSYHKVDFFPLG